MEKKLVPSTSHISLVKYLLQNVIKNHINQIQGIQGIAKEKEHHMLT